MQQITNPYFQYFDNNGNYLANGKIYVYESLTDTEATVYSNATKTVAHANPVVLNARGEALIYGTGPYKFVVKDASETTISTIDPVNGGELYGLQTVEVSSRPSPLGDIDAIETAFTGDLSSVVLPISYTISGSATLGTPATGYLFTPECYPDFLYMKNLSGHNEGTEPAGLGRTCAVARLTKVDNYGQGDCTCNMGFGYVEGAKEGSTHFLANPACSLYYGQVVAGADGVYLNPVEINCHGGDYDVAGINYVMNMFRNVTTGAKDCVWHGLRMQSHEEAIDAWISAIGESRAGLDFTAATFDANEGAISLKAGQRIYFNNEVWSDSTGIPWHTGTWNQDYIYLADTGIQTVVGNNATFQVYTDFAYVSGKFLQANGNVGFFGATGGAQQDGWGTPTNNAVIENFNGTTATLTQTSQAVAQIIANLKTWGFFAA